MNVTRNVFLVAAGLGLGIPGSAQAADMRQPPAAPVYMPPPFTWTGFYIGGNLGGAWAHGTVTDSLFGINFNNGSNNGVFIGGGQVGFNYQFSNYVLGVEGDFDWAANNNNTGTGVVVPGVGTFQASANNRWVATVAARFGVAFDRWLVYGKAGGGWVGSDSFTITNVTTGASISGSNNNTNSGWLVGGGVEWAFANNWSAKIEYDFLGLSNQTFTSPGIILPGDTFSSGNRNIQMAKFGVNYKFGW
jgi:outer membrane immunogenic protein